jgi:hypothetical protein
MCLIIVILNTLYYLGKNKVYLNVFMYLLLLIKDVYIFTKLLILYLLWYINKLIKLIC